jgi:hypothetical protein
MKRYYCLITLSLIAQIAPLISNPTVSFFFTHEQNAAHSTEQLKATGTIAHHSIHTIAEHSPINGICVTYAGYITASDNNGEVRFPRKQKSPTTYLLIAPQVEPIALFENTIDHWKLIPTIPAELYCLRELYNSSLEQYEWHTTREPLPADNIIPLNTILIIANPAGISIPIGTHSGMHSTIKNANLILPSIYVKMNIDLLPNSAYMLNIRHLFRSVESKELQAPLRVTSELFD